MQENRQQIAQHADGVVGQRDDGNAFHRFLHFQLHFRAVVHTREHFAVLQLHVHIDFGAQQFGNAINALGNILQPRAQGGKSTNRRPQTPLNEGLQALQTAEFFLIEFFVREFDQLVVGLAGGKTRGQLIAVTLDLLREGARGKSPGVLVLLEPVSC